MQDEILKHTKKIYTEVNHPTHTLRQKLTEIVVEILIIVFAVTLSIWLHSLSEHKHEQAEVNSFLKGLHDDLQSDIEHYSRDSVSFAKFRELFKARMPLTRAAIDSSVKAGGKFNSDYSLPQIWCTLQEGRYQGFKSSGKIEFIENDSLKTDILSYYEQVIPEIHRREEDFKQIRIQVMNTMVAGADSDKPIYAISKVSMKMLYAQALPGFDRIIANNNWALIGARTIIAEIDEQLK